MIAFFSNKNASANHMIQDHMEHSNQIFHNFILETEIGKSIKDWHFDGWVGGDINKLWLKSEGEISSEKAKKQDFWAMYSRNIASFWDAQIGLKSNNKPDSEKYLTLGFRGLAPYFFETEGHLLINKEGGLGFRIRQENSLLITQKLISKPYLEFNVFNKKPEKQSINRVSNNAEIGLQTRYEISRRFAPYFDLKYQKSFGKNHQIDNQDYSQFSTNIGLRLVF